MPLCSFCSYSRLKGVGVGLRVGLVLGGVAIYKFIVEHGANARCKLQDYLRQIGSTASPTLVPSKELQEELTLPLYLRRVKALVNSAPEGDMQRLSSLGTPHATTWSLATPLRSLSTAAEFKWATSSCLWGLFRSPLWRHILKYRYQFPAALMLPFIKVAIRSIKAYSLFISDPCLFRRFGAAEGTPKCHGV